MGETPFYSSVKYNLRLPMINWTRGGLKGNYPEHKQFASDPCRAGYFDETALLSDFYRS